MATLPTRILEIEFDAGTWTDVTADLVALTSRRGRNRESGAFEPGALSFTLRNDTRQYDPDHAAGTYYGKLRPNRRVRLRATYNAVTYPVFQGYINRISQQAGGPNDATALFDCSDMFKVLNRAELPRSVYWSEKQALAPDMWWPLDEPAGSATVADVGAGKVTGTVYAGTALGAAGLVVRDPGSSMGVTGSLTTGQGFLVDRSVWPSAPLSGNGAFTIEGWFQAGNQTDDATLFFQGSFATMFAEVRIRGAGAFVGLLELRIGLIDVARSTIRVDDNSPHHFVATKTGAGGNLKLFIDGVDRTASAVTDSNSIPVESMSIASQLGASGGLTGTVEHLAVWPTTSLTVTQAATLNTAGRTPWVADTSGTRLGRILDLAAVPAGDRAIDTGSTTLQSTSLGGKALAYAQKIEETEAGWLFVTRDGKVKFISRQNGIVGAYLTSQFTLADADSGVTFPPAVPYRAGDADTDEAIIVTRATVSREGSVAVTVYDATARDEFGWIDETHEGLLHDDDTYSKYYAEWILNTHKTPSSRVGTVEVIPAVNPADNWPLILALELAGRVTYKRKAQNQGSVTTLDMRVEAISHELAGQQWVTKLQLSPFYLAGGIQTGVWDTSLWDQAVWGL